MFGQILSCGFDLSPVLSKVVKDLVIFSIQKRGQNMNQVQYILCDVEGTTTDIRFVHNELFPFARAKLGTFFAENPQEQAQNQRCLGSSPRQKAQALNAQLKSNFRG